MVDTGVKVLMTCYGSVYQDACVDLVDSLGLSGFNINEHYDLIEVGDGGGDVFPQMIVEEGNKFGLASGEFKGLEGVLNHLHKNLNVEGVRV